MVHAVRARSLLCRAEPQAAPVCTRAPCTSRTRSTCCHVAATGKGGASSPQPSSCPALPCPALPCPALPCPALPCLAVAKTSLRISRPHRCACTNQPGVPLLSVPFRCPVPYCCVVLPRCFEVTGAAQVRHLEPDTPADAVGRRRSHTAPAPIRPPLSHNEVRCAITLERRGINSTDGHALPLNRRCC